jgi:hypothetical protein
MGHARPRAVLVAAATAAAGIFIAAVFVTTVADTVWADQPLYHGADKHPYLPQYDSEYCEQQNMNAVLRTQANTWSNLSYWFVGSGFIGTALSDSLAAGCPFTHAVHPPTPPMLSLLFGACCCFLGLGSFVFHASLTLTGHQLDVGGMFAVTNALLATAAFRRHRDYCLHRAQSSSPGSVVNDRRLASVLGRVVATSCIASVVMALAWKVRRTASVCEM